MIWPALLCSAGIPAGFLLIRRIPLCPPPAAPRDLPPVSILIPARNEEQTLPRLLASLAASSFRPAEIIVLDDASTDRTAEVARQLGARVVPSTPLPSGWTGKAWACHQAAQLARSPLLLFLDADTWFPPLGLQRLLTLASARAQPPTAVSVLPYHRMHRPWEQLSLFFNLFMAGGAGGFGIGGRPKLLGQSLLISRPLYAASGGHAAVHRHVLENLRLAPLVHLAGGRTLCRGGRNTLHIRMYPGFLAMWEGWTRAFAGGAKDSGGLVLAASILWISSLFSTFFLLIAPLDYGRPSLAALYLAFSLQVFLYARQLGNYSPLACLLYPLPLAFYCSAFARSLFLFFTGRKTSWRGRAL